MWYNNSWVYRKKITIDNTKVDADLTNFPVYVDLANLGSDFFSHVKSDGGDIRITTSDMVTEVPVEVVGIDTSGQTGELHFKAPSLANSTDTEFYIYYGNPSASMPSASSTYGSQNVWDSNYAAVYHLHANGNDSTANGYHLSASGSPSYVAGKVGKAVDFGNTTGVNLYRNSSNPALSPGSNTPFRITIWANFNSTSANQALAAFCNPNTFARFDWVSGSFRFYRVNESQQQGITTSNTPTTGVWNKYSLNYDGSNVTGYINSSSIGSGAASGIRSTSETGGIGIGHDGQVFGSPSGASPKYKADEVRFEFTSRAAAWETTEYKNQNSPSTFYSIAAEEALLQDVAKTISLVYNIFNDVAKTKAFVYDILNYVSKEKSFVYNILNYIDKTLTVLYNLGETFASKTLSMPYNIYNDVAKSKALVYNILNNVAKEKSFVYNILSSVSKTKTFIYKILAVVNARTIWGGKNVDKAVYTKKEPAKATWFTADKTDPSVYRE